MARGNEESQSAKELHRAKQRPVKLTKIYGGKNPQVLSSV
jgi:hypothetical protein